MPLFLLLRAAAAIFFIISSAYGIVCYSPFAYDAFIRAQHLPAINDFVAWHHAWYLGAYAASALSLARELDPRAVRTGARRVAGWLALAYVAVFGAVAVRLVGTPYLPTLGNDRGSFAAGLVSLVPLAWLAVVDHLASAQALATARETGSTSWRRIGIACAASGAYTWLLHVSRAWITSADRGGLLWLLTGGWTLALTAAAWTIVCATFSFAAAVARQSRAPRAWEYALDTAALAAFAAAVLDRLVLPSISIPAGDARTFSIVAGLVLTAAWSGVALRRAAANACAEASGLDILIAPAFNRATAAAALVLLPLAVVAAIHGIERLDWDFLIQRFIVLAEWAALFGLVLGLTRHDFIGGGDPRTAPLAVAAVLSLAALFGTPRLALVLARATGNHELEPSLSLERGAEAEVSFSLLSRTLVRSSEFDADYFRRVQVHVAPGGTISVPDVTFAAGRVRTPAAKPDIFLFAIDSLRPDYLSPYNPAVTFTPRIGELGRDSLVFRNAFTRYGGTELGMPSIWVGGSVVRGVLGPSFPRINAIEKLLTAEGYRVAINDYTVAPLLQKSTPVTTIDPGVLSADSDLCHNLTSLEAHLDAERGDARPLFAYFAPMNVHLLNTRRGGRPSSSDADYRGFYSPYATRLRRIDACVGDFVGYLKAHGRYDRAVIVLTADHGDSLGEGNNWGHAFWLFPEDVRIPLIVRVPPALAAGVTTDLSRAAFSTDIAPTLYALLGYRVADLGPLFGAPLVAPSGEALADRRKEAVLLTSSYAPTVGLLRRNGRLLFVSDLYEKKEFAFDLADEFAARHVTIDHATRELNHRLVRERLDAVERLYHAAPARTGR